MYQPRRLNNTFVWRRLGGHARAGVAAANHAGAHTRSRDWRLSTVGQESRTAWVATPGNLSRRFHSTQINEIMIAIDWKYPTRLQIYSRMPDDDPLAAARRLRRYHQLIWTACTLVTVRGD
jgi:hypothetical protein